MAQVKLMQSVLASNDALAAAQLAELDRHGVLGINIMAGPGAGKTALVERTAEALAQKYRIHVVEGDLYGDIDAKRVAAKGVLCTQVNTEGGCHLDSMMMAAVWPGLDLAHLDLVIIENVGNLVCPASFRMPVHHDVTLLSTPEGSDKPAKYPLAFSRSDVVIVNKIDLLPYVDFDVAEVRRAVAKLKPDVPVFELSARTGAGLDAWLGWLEGRLVEKRRTRGA
ncbi:MAG: hydrogenase nickel incorporation protein HypB [bacterium]